MNYLNETENALKLRPFYNRTASSTSQTFLANNNADRPILDFTDEVAVYQSQGLKALIDRLNLIICRGQLHPNIENIIIDTIEDNIANVASYDTNDIINDAIYYIMISPNYTIQK